MHGLAPPTRGTRSDLLSIADQKLGRLGVPPESVRFIDGVPQNVIVDFAGAIDAGVIVLGTAARSGAAGLMVGNTAEAVVERSECDLFVVNRSRPDS